MLKFSNCLGHESKLEIDIPGFETSLKVAETAYVLPLQASD